MTPNPHRGSDFNDFLAEEDLMTPTMTPTNDLPTQLREFNRWRRGGEGRHPNPSKIGVMIDAAADRLEELEEQLAANHEAIKLMGKWLEDERALADRLALIVDDIRYYDGLSPGAKQPVTEALAAWKESRRE